MVKSPGVPGAGRPVAAARAAGVPVWSEVELAARMLPNPIAGVTGTNGKTTTTELLGAMLRAGGIAIEVAGNVGRPLSELAGRIDAGTWIACELSSFQLEDIDTLRAPRRRDPERRPPTTSTGTAASRTTCAASCACFENQRPGDIAVLNADDPLPARRGASRATASASRSPGPMRDAIDWEHAGLRGDHNLENAIAAAAAARAAGVDARRHRPRPARVRAAAAPARAGRRAPRASSS